MCKINAFSDNKKITTTIMTTIRTTTTTIKQKREREKNMYKRLQWIPIEIKKLDCLFFLNFWFNFSRKKINFCFYSIYIYSVDLTGCFFTFFFFSIHFILFYVLFNLIFLILSKFYFIELDGIIQKHFNLFACYGWHACMHFMLLYRFFPFLW